MNQHKRRPSPSLLAMVAGDLATYLRGRDHHDAAVALDDLATLLTGGVVLTTRAAGATLPSTPPRRANALTPAVARPRGTRLIVAGMPGTAGFSIPRLRRLGEGRVTAGRAGGEASTAVAAPG